MTHRNYATWPVIPDDKAAETCCCCGKHIEGEEAIPGADPFCSELSGDDTPVVMCNACRRERWEDT